MNFTIRSLMLITGIVAVQAAFHGPWLELLMLVCLSIIVVLFVPALSAIFLSDVKEGQLNIKPNSGMMALSWTIAFLVLNLFLSMIHLAIFPPA